MRAHTHTHTHTHAHTRTHTHTHTTTRAHARAGAPGLSPLALSGALSRALCLVHRLRAPSAHHAAAPHGAASGPGGRCRPRVLCMLGSPDVPMQYIPVMNTIFSAQRAEVAVDTLMLGPPGRGAHIYTLTDNAHIYTHKGAQSTHIHTYRCHVMCALNHALSTVSLFWLWILGGRHVGLSCALYNVRVTIALAVIVWPSSGWID